MAFSRFNPILMRKLVAIVGRPNVGKSALFNRLAGKNISIVHDQPGVTRDRIMAECRRGPEIFDIMDTGGIGANTDDVLTAQVQTEASIALEVADLLLFVVDVTEGISPIDQALAMMLRKVSKPVILVCNKADSPKRRAMGPEFTRLGFNDQIEVSAAHGLGIENLVDRVSDKLNLEEPEPEDEGDVDPDAPKLTKKQKSDLARRARPIKLAIVGRPNAGKSSLVNAFLGKDRAIVSPVAGTTRDALDIQCVVKGNPYQLIDTAGIRRSSRIDDKVEAFSIQRAMQSIERADICMLVVDCGEGIKSQDRKIAQLILEAHKPCIIIMNKWDLFKPNEPLKDRTKLLEEHARREFFFLHYAPVIAVSAAKKQHLEKIFACVERIREGAQNRVGTGVLNRLLHFAVDNSPGPLGAGSKTFKLLYASQVNHADDRPVPVPHFVLFANRAHRLQDSYLRYLEGRIREEFKGEGLPFFLKVKAKGANADRIDNK